MLLKRFRNHYGLVKIGEEWFSLGENHVRRHGFGLHQLRNRYEGEPMATQPLVENGRSAPPSKC